MQSCTRGIGASVHGSPGCPFLRFLALGTQRKEAVIRGWVSRRGAKTPGEPWPGERACHGRQAQDLQARARRAERSKPAFAPGTGVRRAKMTVRWMVIPSNGLATDGEPRAFERRRESGSEDRAWGEPSEPTEERGNPGFWGAESGVPFLSVPCFGHAKKGGRRTGVGEPETAKRPVDAWPGERACHG